MRMFGLTLVGFGLLLYLLFPKADKHVQTQILRVLLLGDLLHLYTAFMHRDSKHLTSLELARALACVGLGCSD
jgi:hypothetical protein